MAISLNKKTGISLKKGSTISLEKQGKLLEHVCVGLNWGAIQRKALFGLIKETESVDLDGGITVFDKNNVDLDTVYFNNLRSRDGAIIHHGDDLKGDAGEDDGIDNEVIEIDLSKVNPDIEQIVFYLNSYKGHDFGLIPFSKIRIFEGTKDQVDDVFATFNLSVDESFKGNVSMVLGKLVRTRSNWEFKAIGEPLNARRLGDAIPLIQEKYL